MGCRQRVHEPLQSILWITASGDWVNERTPWPAVQGSVSQDIGTHVDRGHREVTSDPLGRLYQTPDRISEKPRRGGLSVCGCRLGNAPDGPSCPVGSRIGTLECLDPACVALPPSQSNKDRDVSGLIQTDGSGRRRG
jgi:hypothetical protein